MLFLGFGVLVNGKVVVDVDTESLEMMCFLVGTRSILSCL